MTTSWKADDWEHAVDWSGSHVAREPGSDDLPLQHDIPLQPLCPKTADAYLIWIWEAEGSGERPLTSVELWMSQRRIDPAVTLEQVRWNLRDVARGIRREQVRALRWWRKSLRGLHPELNVESGDDAP